MTGAALNNLRQSAKPILFETGLSERPYSGVGTGFLVLFRSQIYLLTASHVLRDENLDNLLIFPNDDADKSIPFDAQFIVVKPDPVLIDYADISIVRVALDKLFTDCDLKMHAIRLDNTFDGPRTSPQDYQLVFFGYPNQARYVDYDEFRIASTQHLLVGELAIGSGSSHCYELEIKDFNGVSDLNGFSGSPVVAIPRTTSINKMPSLCGMVIRGDKAAGRVRFIDVAALKYALEKAN